MFHGYKSCSSNYTVPKLYQTLVSRTDQTSLKGKPFLEQDSCQTANVLSFSLSDYLRGFDCFSPFSNNTKKRHCFPKKKIREYVLRADFSLQSLRDKQGLTGILKSRASCLHDIRPLIKPKLLLILKALTKRNNSFRFKRLGSSAVRGDAKIRPVLCLNQS